MSAKLPMLLSDDELGREFDRLQRDLASETLKAKRFRRDRLAREVILRANRECDIDRMYALAVASVQPASGPQEGT